jgi:hypothetical protein
MTLPESIFFAAQTRLIQSKPTYSLVPSVLDDLGGIFPQVRPRIFGIIGGHAAEIEFGALAENSGIPGLVGTSNDHKPVLRCAKGIGFLGRLYQAMTGKPTAIRTSGNEIAVLAGRNDIARSHTSREQQHQYCSFHVAPSL